MLPFVSGTGPLFVILQIVFTAIVTVPVMSAGSVNSGSVLVASAVVEVFVRFPVTVVLIG